jgi:hypothetical protein
MKEVFWIQKYRQQIFVLEILVAIIFGPALANAAAGGTWMTIGFVLGVFLTLEISLGITRAILAKAALEKTKRTHKNFKAAHQAIKKDYQELTGEQLTKKPAPSIKKKPRRKKGKKTHRR